MSPCNWIYIICSLNEKKSEDIGFHAVEFQARKYRCPTQQWQGAYLCWYCNVLTKGSTPPVWKEATNRSGNDDAAESAKALKQAAKSWSNHVKRLKGNVLVALHQKRVGITRLNSDKQKGEAFLIWINYLRKAKRRDDSLRKKTTTQDCFYYDSKESSSHLGKC